MHESEPIRLATNSDAVTAVPLLLGHVPAHSLVAIGIADGAIACTARVDLPESYKVVHQLAPITVQLLHGGAEAATLLAYGPARLGEASLDLAEADLRDAGISLAGRIRVTEGRYFSEETHPFAGAAVPQSAADATLLDRASNDDRTSVAHAINRRIMAETDHDWTRQRQTDIAAVEHWLDATALPEPDGIAALAMAAIDIDFREWAIAAAEPHLTTGDRPVELWLWVLRHVGEEWLPACASLLAHFAYRRGNDALAREAVNQALRSDPSHRPARLIREALHVGLPPDLLPRRRPDIDRSTPAD